MNRNPVLWVAALTALSCQPAATAPRASRVVLVHCPPGHGNCDGDDANGCETDLQQDPGSCGACDVACASPDGAPTGCFNGVCRILWCPEGTCDPDQRADDGCEGVIDPCHGNCVLPPAPSYGYCY